ncbi:hypothetical protein H6X67_08460, partial [Actinomyces sp. AC-20-1]|nr:hypothetical protein [Actinomyces sp. AC-20-1]
MSPSSTTRRRPRKPAQPPAAGLREFSLRVVDALGGRVAAVKPQSAFYERHGSAGVAVLEE